MREEVEFSKLLFALVRNADVGQFVDVAGRVGVHDPHGFGNLLVNLPTLRQGKPGRMSEIVSTNIAARPEPRSSARREECI